MGSLAGSFIILEPLRKLRGLRGSEIARLVVQGWGHGKLLLLPLNKMHLKQAMLILRNFFPFFPELPKGRRFPKSTVFFLFGAQSSGRI